MDVYPYTLRFVRRSQPGISTAAVGGPSVAIDGTPIGTLTHSGITADCSITVANQSNRALIALIGNDDTHTVSGVAYTVGSGGAWAFLNKIVAGNVELEIWSSLAPSTGSVTAQATMSGTAVQDVNFVLYSVYNVDQTTPVDGYVSAGSGSASTTLSSGGMILGHVVNNSGGIDPLITGTEDYNQNFNSFWRAAHNASTGTIAYTAGQIINVCNVRKA